MLDRLRPYEPEGQAIILEKESAAGFMVKIGGTVESTIKTEDLGVIWGVIYFHDDRFHPLSLNDCTLLMADCNEVIFDQLKKGDRLDILQSKRAILPTQGRGYSFPVLAVLKQELVVYRSPAYRLNPNMRG